MSLAGAVDRSCGLGLSGWGCWGRSGQGSGTHGHTGELPGHSRPQRPLQAEGGWVGLWSRASAGHSPGWGGRGGCGVYGGLSECSLHRASLLSPRPELGGVRGASSSTSRSCWLPGPGAHRPSRRPPPCVSASLLRHLHPGPPSGSSTSDASLTFTGKTLSHRSWGSGPQHVSEDLRSAHGTISAAARLPRCRLGHALSQAAFSGRSLAQGAAWQKAERWR